MPKNNGIANHLSRWFSLTNEKLTVVATYDLFHNASVLTEKQIGLTIGLKDLIYAENHPTLTFVPLEPKLTEKISIIWKKDYALPPAAQIFLDYLSKN